MKQPPLLRIIACALIVLPGCALHGEKDKAKTDTPEPSNDPKLVGVIASIPADRKFVLIQSYGKWKVETGTILTTRGAEHRSANLVVTGETLGQFAAADLQSGSVERGDAVYSRHTPKPVEPAAEAPPTEGPTTADPELPKP